MRSILCYLALIFGLVATAAGESPDVLAAKGAGTCTPGPKTLCLLGGRFSVEIDWEDAAMTAGNGQTLPIASDEWGFFYFDDPRYVDLMVKVLDACALFDHYFVFLAGLSDYQQTVTVTDTVEGKVQSYFKPLGNYVDVADTEAFPCSAIVAPLPRPRGLASAPAMTLAGRFSVDLAWQDAAMTTGFGQPVPLTSHSGYFWLFAGDQADVAVKVFDASAVDGHYWIVFGATNDLGLDLHVTDLCSGLEHTLTRPLAATGTVVDKTTFLADQTCDVFSDGFESGDTTVWSVTVPPP